MTVLFDRAGFVGDVAAGFIPGKCCPPQEKEGSAPQPAMTDSQVRGLSPQSLD